MELIENSPQICSHIHAFLKPHSCYTLNRRSRRRSLTDNGESVHFPSEVAVRVRLQVRHLQQRIQQHLQHISPIKTFIQRSSQAMVMARSRTLQEMHTKHVII